MNCASLILGNSGWLVHKARLFGAARYFLNEPIPQRHPTEVWACRWRREQQHDTIEAVSLDDYIWTELVPDFVKWDVEGAEVEVFGGAQIMLKEKRPMVL